MELHASTQMTVTKRIQRENVKGNGLLPVVPARELSLEEIFYAYKETGMDIETFVHGAFVLLCYSGQCLMSSLIGGRSGNRGAVVPSRRLPYRMGRRQGRGKKA